MKKGSSSLLKKITFSNPLVIISKTVYLNNEKIKEILNSISRKCQLSPMSNQKKEIIGISKDHKHCKHDGIIAIGGGKIIDIAKLVSGLLITELEDFSVFDSNFNRLSLIVIPTTPGSGSDANGTAVYIDQGHKLSIVSNSLIPDIAILDSSLIETLDKPNLVYNMADIFAHIIESKHSRLSNRITDALSKGVLIDIRKLFKQIILESETNHENLLDLQILGYIGGSLVGSAFVGANHALAHSLEQLDPSITHGQSVLLFMKSNIIYHKNKDPDENSIWKHYLDIFNEVGFDKYINKEILENVDRVKLVEGALNDPSIKTDSIRMKSEDLEVIVSQIG